MRDIDGERYDVIETAASKELGSLAPRLAVTRPRENEEIVGSARYWLNPTTNLAEVAFMVLPEWQGTGIGTAVQTRLAEYAISRGVRGFVASILPDNTRMPRPSH